MAKAKIRCPKCGRRVSHGAKCPACGADVRARSEPRQAQQHPADADARKAMLIKILVIGVVLVAISGIIGFGMENMSSGWLYSVMLSFRLNNATVALAAKVLFWLSLGTVVVSFAMLQQMMEK